MLSTQKLMELANQNFNDNYTAKPREYDKTSYLSGYYDGYLMGQKPVYEKHRGKKVSQTSTGKLASVGIGVNKNVVSE